MFLRYFQGLIARGRLNFLIPVLIVLKDWKTYIHTQECPKMAMSIPEVSFIDQMFQLAERVPVQVFFVDPIVVSHQDKVVPSCERRLQALSFSMLAPAFIFSPIGDATLCTFG